MSASAAQPRRRWNDSRTGHFTCPVVCSLLLLAAGACSASADVSSYAVSRYVSYQQTSDAPPTTPEFWLFVALAASDTNGEMVAGSVEFDRPPLTALPFFEATVTVHEYVSALYDNPIDFLADFPATTYTVTVDRGFGPETGSVYLPEDLFSPEIPAFTGDTFTRLQGMDPALDFVGSINAFTLAAGANSGWTHLAVVPDLGSTGAAWAIILDRDETTFTIPAGTLEPDTGYSIGLTFFSQAFTPNAGFIAADSGAEFHRGTGGAFRTLSPAPGCPADFNESGSVTVQDIFDFLAAYFGADPRADFNASGATSVQDIFDFLAAYFIGCP